MSPKTTYDYEEITRSAEETIRRLVSTGKEKEKNWAIGAFIAWTDLTLGYKQQEDYDRLEALAYGQNLVRAADVLLGKTKISLKKETSRHKP